MWVVVAVTLEALRAAVVKHKRHIAGIVFAYEGGDLAVVVRGGAGRLRPHVSRYRLLAQNFVKVEAELGEQCRLEALQPHIQVRRLHCLLGLTSEQVLASLLLPLEQLTPGDELGVGTVQAEQGGQEVPLGQLGLAAQQLCHYVHLHLEALLHPAHNGMVKPGRAKKKEGGEEVKKEPIHQSVIIPPVGSDIIHLFQA